MSILLQELLMIHLTHRSSCNDEVNEPNLIIEWKDTYLICEDEIFTLIMLVVVEVDVLMLPPNKIFVEAYLQAFKLIDLNIWSFAASTQGCLLWCRDPSNSVINEHLHSSSSIVHISHVVDDLLLWVGIRVVFYWKDQSL